MLETCKVPFIDPPHLLVLYGDPAWANCSTTDQPSMMGWESPVGSISGAGITHLIWTLQSVTTWTVGGRTQCYTISDSGSSCTSNLNITIYSEWKLWSLTCKSTFLSFFISLFYIFTSHFARGSNYCIPYSQCGISNNTFYLSIFLLELF